MRALWVACFAAVVATPAAAQEPGAIRAFVSDADFGVPLGQVRMTVVETGQSALSTPEGGVLLSDVPPGEYTITFTKAGFERQLRVGTVVAPGRLTELRVALAADVIEMAELVVTGGDLLGSTEIGALELRAEALGLQDGVSAELISRAGASDVAQALKLVVGASVAEGKYATVRGLSDRYTGTTLNGLRVPSADPRRRAVQVDLFPTGTIDSVTVTKTFRPDLQGDFTGGGVDLRTKAIPDGLVLRVGVSIEHDSIATGNARFLTYDGGGAPALGFDSSREIPAIAAESLGAFPPVPMASQNPTPEQVEGAAFYDELTKSFAPAMGVSREAPPPNVGISFVGGNRWTVGDGVIGTIGAVTWKRSHSLYLDAPNNAAILSTAGSSIGLDPRRSDSKGTEEVTLGTLGTFVYRPNDRHDYAFRFVLNQAAEDSARFQVEDPTSPVIERNQTLHYIQRTILSTQVHGSHRLRSLLLPRADDASMATLDWAVSWNATRQWEPDVRFFRTEFDTAAFFARVPQNSRDAGVSRRVYRDIEETNIQARVDWNTPFESPIGDDEGAVKVGAFTEITDRDYDQTSFTYSFARQAGNAFVDPAVAENIGFQTFQGDSIDDLWSDVFTDEERIGLATNMPPAPNQLVWFLMPIGTDVEYVGEQTIEAAYAMADIPLLPSLRFVGGVRWERTDISIFPTNAATGDIEIIDLRPSGNRALVAVPQDAGNASIDDERFLPSVSLAWEMAPNMTLRAAWSRTLARPTFRELAPVATIEFLAGDEFIGNPDLSFSKITNYDLRWEWFRRPGEVLAASVFYKEIVDPIELISFAIQNRDFIQPINYENGTVRGIELEGRTSLDIIHPALSTLVFGANLTLLETEVALPEIEKEGLSVFGLEQETRALQGQPEYLLNVNLTWDDEDLGMSAGVFYNVVGETLVTGAAAGFDNGRPDLFETSSETLDVTFNKTITERISLSMKAKNLLLSDDKSIHRTPDGESAIHVLRETPMKFSFGVTYEW